VSKLGAWLLLMIISFVLVSLVHGIGPTRRSVLRPAASDTQAM